jgi:hypothetical protein
VNLSELIRACQEAPQIPFLVIGGHAVIAHGHARLTFDVDLLVRRDQREAWLSKLAPLGFTVFREHPVFIQFQGREPGLDLDLMLVGEPTFSEMLARAQAITLGGLRLQIPCLDHLLALKLHAAKQGQPHRVIKDLDDLIMLVLKNGLDIRSPNYQQLFLKYGNAETYERVLRATQPQ